MPRPATAYVPELHTLEEIQELTGISVRSLRSALRSRTADGWLLSRRWYMSAAQLECYLSSRRQEVPSNPQTA